ncbi:MAG TPA: serine/threonine-protein kinase [Vicinamibacterales bacterium]|nr:serine/threonine-protein kinase [Vicinamibacterales bacterium]
METRGLPLPPNIGRFRIESLLGSGGMGEVYKAVDPTLQRTVAVKTVRRDITKPESLDRLYREAQACARLRHPNIVTVFEAGEHDGTVYIAMEYLHGEDLAAALRRGALSLEERIRVLLQVLDALQHAHTENVIHRDIKPSNVHLLPDGSIKLVDFGLAHMLLAETMTATAAIVGTPHYASPEQLKGEPIDLRTDIYSAGALAYELFSGHPPFQAENESFATLILKVISEPLPPMASAWSRRIPELERIVGRAMSKSPAQRFQSANEMRDALAAVLESSLDAIQSPGETSGRRSRNKTSQPLWWVSGVAAAVVIAAALIFPRPSASIADAAAGDVRKPLGATSDVPPLQAESVSMQQDPQAKPRDLLPPGSPSLSAAPRPADSAGDDGVKEVSAKALFGGEGASTPANAGLRYRLVQQSPDGAEIDVDPATTTFRSGDRVRFAFESNIDGYLYVVQQGSSGRWTVLFPHLDINGGKNAVRRLSRYQVPPEDWFRFDANPGTEQVFVFLSREPYSQLPGFERPVTKTETVTASIVEALQETVRSRDLVLEKDRPQGRSPSQATYVVNRTEVGKSVVASISLTHKQ